MTDELDWILLHYGGYCCGQVEASDVDKQFFEAKQAIQALIDRECKRARIDEAKYARSRLLIVGSWEHKLQTQHIQEMEKEAK